MEPYSPETPPAQPIARANSTLNYVIIAITFLVIGAVMGIAGREAMINRGDVEAAVRTVLADTKVSIDESALQSVVASLPVPVANPDSSPGNTLDAAAVSQLVIQALAEQEKAKVENERIIIEDNDPSMGADDAPITIVEFSAYACPYCGRHFQETFKPLLENYGQYIHYVYRDYPVINQEVSFPTSMASECAYEQDKFWEFHDAMFSNQDKLNRDFYLQTAGDIGLDVASFTQCVDEKRYESEVMDDYYAGDALNITGTPTFWINGEIISGALPYDRFERLILKKLGELGITADVKPEPAAS